MWKRTSGPHAVDQFPRYDMARGWEYTIQRDEEGRTVSVVVSRGISADAMPVDATAAYQTRGRSAVDAVLDQDDPPRYLVITDSGVIEERK